MATIATTSHQKEITVNISLFTSSQQFKFVFMYIFSLPEKLIITEIYKSLIWRRILSASRAVRSIELDI